MDNLKKTLNNSAAGGIVGTFTGNPIVGTVAGALSSGFNSLKNKFTAPRPQKAVEPSQQTTKKSVTGNSTKTWETTGGNTSGNIGSLASSYNQATNPSISNLYNSSLKYGSGGVTDPSIYTQSSERLARDTNQALADAALSPDQTKSYFEGRTGMIQDLASKRAANLSSVMDQNRQQQQLGLAGVKQAFDIAQPRTIGPSDMVYNALQSNDDINNRNQSSAFTRNFNVGQNNAASDLGAQSVGNATKIAKLDESQKLLGGLFNGQNNLGLVPLNEWKNKIQALASSGQISSLVTALNGIAEQLPEGSQKQELLKGLQGDLSNMSPLAIQKALEAASAQIGTQNTAIQNVIGGNQGGNQTGFTGYTNGGAF